MFIEFFYLLRKRGLKVSLNEWMALMEALNQGLAQSSLTSFYYLCRAVLIKSETEYDKFDLAFAEFLKVWNIRRIFRRRSGTGWKTSIRFRSCAGEGNAESQAHDFEELQKMLEERLKEQKEEHHGGGYWIGTGGTSPFGHGGYNPAGIRIGGESVHRSALQVAGERNFRISGRTISSISGVFRWRSASYQFSSKNDGPKTELNVDATIQETCDNAGNLKLIFDRPRKKYRKGGFCFSIQAVPCGRTVRCAASCFRRLTNRIISKI